MATGEPVLVLRGEPSPSELAAVVSVLAALAGAGHGGAGGEARSRWADPRRTWAERRWPPSARPARARRV